MAEIRIFGATETDKRNLEKIARLEQRKDSPMGLILLRRAMDNYLRNIQRNKSKGK